MLPPPLPPVAAVEHRTLQLRTSLWLQLGHTFGVLYLLHRDALGVPLGSSSNGVLLFARLGFYTQGADQVVAMVLFRVLLAQLELSIRPRWHEFLAGLRASRAHTQPELNAAYEPPAYLSPRRLPKPMGWGGDDERRVGAMKSLDDDMEC